MTFKNLRHQLIGAAMLGLFGLGGCQGCDEELSQVRSKMTLNPQEVELNPVPVAADTLIVFEVGNPSSISFNIRDIRLSDDSDPAFVIVDQPESVSPQSTETIQVKVRPMFPTTIEATLIVESDADVTPELEAKISATSADMGLPDIEVDPLEVVFAEVARIDVARAEVIITNVGVRDLLLDDFQLTWAQVNEPPPPVEVATDGGLPATDSDGGNTTPPSDSPSQPDGGSATGGGSAGASAENSGNDMDGGTSAGASPFHLITSVPPSWPLPPGQSLTLELAFSPEVAAAYSGELKIFSNDPDEPVVVVNLSGQGYTCPVAIAKFLDEDEIDGLEPLDNIRVDGTDSYAQTAGGSISEYEWRLLQRPVGSTAIMEPTSARAQIQCDLAGEYEVSLSVYDDRGLRSCEDDTLRFSCVPTEELHVQLVWDHPYADFDLHLLKESGEVFDHESDTYFSNREPDWYPENPGANPILDLDDNQGYGPENINVETPLPGARYSIYVHYWDAQTDGDAFAIATIRVFAYGQMVGEHQLAFEADETMWQAAEIVWAESSDAGTQPLPVINLFTNTIPYPRPF